MLKIKSHLEELIRIGPEDKQRKDFLRLDMNEDPVGLPKNFIDTTLKDITPEYLATYPEYTNLISKIAMHNNIADDNICLSNGSDSAIKYIFDAYISPDDKVLFTDPTFAMYPVYCQMAGAKSILFPYEQDFSFSVEDFCSLIDDTLKMVVIVNPNNPIGTAIPVPDLLRIIGKCAEYGILAVVDEAYYYFYNKTMINLVNQYDNLIVLRTFSKLCGLANVRLGYAATNPMITSHLHKVKPTFDVNGFAVFIAEKLLDSKDIIQNKIEEINKGKFYIKKKLLENGFDFHLGEANFVIIKCPGSVPDVVKKMHKRNILVSGGFKQEYLNDYIRVTIGNTDIMKKFWVVFSEMVWECVKK